MANFSWPLAIQLHAPIIEKGKLRPSVSCASSYTSYDQEISLDFTSCHHQIVRNIVASIYCLRLHWIFIQVAIVEYSIEAKSVLSKVCHAVLINSTEVLLSLAVVYHCGFAVYRFGKPSISSFRRIPYIWSMGDRIISAVMITAYGIIPIDSKFLVTINMTSRCYWKTNYF